MRAVFWLTAAGTRGKRIVVSVEVGVDILIDILIIEFLEVNDELVTILDGRILPRGQEAVLQPIALIDLEIDVILFMFMHSHGTLLR